LSKQHVDGVARESPNRAGRTGNPNESQEQLHKYTKLSGKRNVKADLAALWQKM